MASLIFNWKRVEAESRILKQSSEHRERQFSEPLKCLNMWECLSEARQPYQNIKEEFVSF